jgi:hypothetical protein
LRGQTKCSSVVWSQGFVLIRYLDLNGVRKN